MTRGFAPLPTAIKRLNGNPGKRALNDAEPMPTRVSYVKPPKTLSPGARRVWRRLIPELDRLGLLTTVDLDTFAAYCQAVDVWTQATTELNRNGRVIETEHGLKASPLVKIANDALAQFTRLAQEFGFTPSSRSRIKVDKPSEASLADILFSGTVDNGD